MKTLSIRQPWAWLIVYGGKDIENRSRRTNFRGRFLVHASQGMTRQEYNMATWIAGPLGITIPPFDELQRGGIIGSVELVDCLEDSNSPWYMGEKGYLLRDPRPLPFVPYKGQLGFFDVPESLVQVAE
ncbi:ASCH domain-containing protein [Pseudomonas aeruginosa]|uniref:ASCH domain-containing protein n=1 Tax=Pseudomonas aeruginosa TaxID=287 RepID=UPI00104F394D|nr:ASCH domain-containing protein [Pseudomonas aeruginosa]MBO8337080.1 ASCH domain-containing protein [Pseudomonas aeruginosa]HCF0590415.1 ASCH domain-containing protein [Pseudomonas aeruginosa]HCF4080875.1 ASCH domain-containing protein [Pseudomonas aeruginosa]HDV6123000.1 ASCH domain-containing protein [Pseudomonas aeruginosa]HDV6143878.1 ASCH domain-containing protein [Pseudomonas aeruginosa]